MKSAKNMQYSNQQPVWQMAILLISTFGFYKLYWFYRNWKELYPQNNIKIRAWLRTLGVFLPLVGTILVWFQLDDIKKFANKENVPAFPYPGWMLLVYILLTGASRVFLPKAFFVLSLSFISLLFLIMQTTLNRYWAKIQPNLAIRSRLTLLESIFIILGSVLFLILLKGCLHYLR